MIGLIIVICIILIIIVMIISNSRENRRKRRRNSSKNQGGKSQEEIEKKYQEEWKKWEQEKQEFSELLTKYGVITNEIRMENFKSSNNIFIFEESSTIIIYKVPYKFDDILGFEVYDNGKTIFSGTTSETTTSTNTGNMLGRALVGGVLAGGVGAIIGAATAKKDIKSQVISQTAITEHNYDVVLIMNSLSTPTLKVNFNNNQNSIQEFVAVLSIILKRNRSN